MAKSKKYSGISGLNADDVISFAFENNKFVGYFKDSDGIPKIQSPSGADAEIIKSSDELIAAFNIEKFGKLNVVDSVEFASDEEQQNFFDVESKKETNESFISPDLVSQGVSFPVATIKNYARRGRTYRRGGQILPYPFDIDLEQDHLKITQYQYIRPEKSNVQASRPPNKGMAGDTVINKNKPYGEYKGGVILPMPKVSDSNGAEWGKSDLSVFGLGLASILDDVNAAATGRFLPDLQGLGSKAAGEQFDLGNRSQANFGLDFRNDLLQVLQNAKTESSRAIGNAGGTFRAGLAVGAEKIGRLTGIDLSADEFLARSSGSILNPNAELLFQGPVLRDFAFKFLMIARNEDEGKIIRKIIKFFKTGAAPIFDNVALLKTPNVFQLEYKRGRQTLSTVNKFNEMALRTITVDYAPDGFWSAYQDSQPVALIMNLQFSELRPIYQQDQANEDDDSVGY